MPNNYINTTDKKCYLIVQNICNSTSVQMHTNLFAQNPRQTCADDEKHTNTAVIKYSVHRVFCSTHTIHWLHITHIYVCTGEKKTLGNDVHRITSKIWAQVWIAHLSSRTSLFFFRFQLYIYLCSGWVMCWAPICHWSSAQIRQK